MIANISFKKMILTTVFFFALVGAHAAPATASAPVSDIATGEGVGLPGHPQSKSNVCHCDLSPAPIVANANYDQLLGGAVDTNKPSEGSN